MTSRLQWERRQTAIVWRTAGTVRDRLRFAGREILGRRLTAEYQLRRSGLRVVIRHPMVDVGVLWEVFGTHAYAIPDAVRAQLIALARPIRVLDLGGNVGLFGLYIHEMLPGAELVSFEPDPRNLAVLERCVGANPGLNWEVVPAAAGTADGTASFISDFGAARLQAVAQDFGGHKALQEWLPEGRRKDWMRPTTAEVQVRDVFPYLEDCDLLKIDIEGGEWELLTDPRFAETSTIAVVLEAHPLPGQPAGPALDQVFAASGFAPARPWTSGSTPDVIWAVRPS